MKDVHRDGSTRRSPNDILCSREPANPWPLATYGTASGIAPPDGTSLRRVTRRVEPSKGKVAALFLHPDGEEGWIL